MRGVLQLAARRRSAAGALALAHRPATVTQHKRWVRPPTVPVRTRARQDRWIDRSIECAIQYHDITQHVTKQASRLLGVRARGLASEATAGAAAAGAPDGEGPPQPARVWTWGQGTEGQLGHYPFEKSGITNSYQELSPRELRLGKEGEGHNALGFVELAAGLNHSAGVTADGKVGGWVDPLVCAYFGSRSIDVASVLTCPSLGSTRSIHSCTRGATARITSLATGTPSRHSSPSW